MPAFLIDAMTWLGIGTAATTVVGAVKPVTNVTSSPLLKYGLIAAGVILLLKIIK